jgi:hypothetical protein
MWIEKVMPLEEIMRDWVPGSIPQPWSWEDEAQDLDQRVCCCRSMTHLKRLGGKGHYQRKIEKKLKSGWFGDPVMLGNDGRVWDGHHRIIASWRQGRKMVPAEIFLEDPC